MQGSARCERRARELPEIGCADATVDQRPLDPGSGPIPRELLAGDTHKTLCVGLEKHLVKGLAVAVPYIVGEALSVALAAPQKVTPDCRHNFRRQANQRRLVERPVEIPAKHPNRTASLDTQKIVAQDPLQQTGHVSFLGMEAMRSDVEGEIAVAKTPGQPAHRSLFL
jgi:hypothetical protein